MRSSRHLLATLAVLAGLVLAGPAIVSVWVHHDLLDTPRFTAAVAPLAAEPAVQTAVAGAATRAVDAYLGGAAPDEPGSPAPAVNAAAQQLVTSTRFPGVWTSVTATAHRQLVTQVRSGVRPTTATIALAPVLAALPGLGSVASARALAAAPASVTVPLGSSARTVADTVQRADRASGRLPWLAGGLLLLGVAVSPWWRVTLVVAGLGTAAVAAGVWAAAGAARDAAGDHLVSGGDGPLVRAVAVAVTGPLRDHTVDVGAIALVVAAAAALWAVVARVLRSRRDRTRTATQDGVTGGGAWSRSADRPTAG